MRIYKRGVGEGTRSGLSYLRSVDAPHRPRTAMGTAQEPAVAGASCIAPGPPCCGGQCCSTDIKRGGGSRYATALSTQPIFHSTPSNMNEMKAPPLPFPSLCRAGAVTPAPPSLLSVMITHPPGYGSPAFA
jgi:hypothetical protein